MDGRRRFLQVIVASAAFADKGCVSVEAAGVPLPSDPEEYDAAFPQAIASGDPSPSSVLLWTRVQPFEAPIEIAVDWCVASDEAFLRVIASVQADIMGREQLP